MKAVLKDDIEKSVRFILLKQGKIIQHELVRCKKSNE